MDTETFISVREDLYSNKENFSVNINQLKTHKLWINGFHDFVMNGHEVATSKDNGVVTFYKSAHYPHIEENEHFNETLNEFIKKI
jgi:proline iminopeptidase